MSRSLIGKCSFDPERHIGIVGFSAASNDEGSLDTVAVTVLRHLALGDPLE